MDRAERRKLLNLLDNLDRAGESNCAVAIAVRQILMNDANDRAREAEAAQRAVVSGVDHVKEIHEMQDMLHGLEQRRG